MSRGAGCGSPTTWLRSNFRHRQPEQPLRTFELGSHKLIINCSDRGYSFEAMFAASTEECQREGVGSWPDFQGEHIRPRNEQEDLIESTFAFEGKDGSVIGFGLSADVALHTYQPGVDRPNHPRLSGRQQVSLKVTVRWVAPATTWTLEYLLNCVAILCEDGWVGVSPEMRPQCSDHSWCKDRCDEPSCRENFKRSVYHGDGPPQVSRRYVRCRTWFAYRHAFWEPRLRLRWGK